jgi:hypothetical protein
MRQSADAALFRLIEGFEMFDSEDRQYCTTGQRPPKQEARNGKRFSEEDEFLICELAKSKMMAYQIAIKFDTTAERIAIVCREYGVELISRKNQKNKRTKQILALLQNGYTSKQIMNQVDCDQNLVNQVRKHHGLSRSKSCATIRVMQSYEMAKKLVRDGMTVKEACASVKISDSSYGKYKRLENKKALEN